MPANPPVSFQQMAQSGGNPSSGGYPYQIRASDMDKNFVFATLDADASLIETTTGQGGHTARKLKIPALPGGDDPQQLTATGGALSWVPGIPPPPASGTHVLGAVDGQLQWLATEEC
jgi:hypothetical protein